MNTRLSSLSAIINGTILTNFGLFKSFQNCYQIYDVMRKAILDAEIAFHQKESAGKDKKYCVLAALQAATDDLGESWEKLDEHFSALVDAIITLWNVTHKE